MKEKNPKFIKIFICPLNFIADKEVKESFLNYILFKYNDLKNRRGRILAFIFCCFQIMQIYISLIFGNLKWSIVMLINYLKIGIRNIKKYKTFSFINISGLAIGLASVILIYLWSWDELSYDRFHKKYFQAYKDRFHRSG